jgi:hypothetical protein
MTALLTPRRPARRMREGDCHPLPAETDQGPTLDDVITRAWEVLRADVPAACPVCGGELVPRPSAGSGVVGGRCESCGTSLA